jgi:ABC-type antimicrobial peptide transport system permease subunit
VVALDKNSNFETFRDELKRNADVVSVTGSVQPLGKYSKQMVVKIEGADQTVQGVSALPGFTTQMGIKVTNGRDMNATFGTDQTSSVLVNRAFLKQMHWTTGVGKTIEYEKHNYLIVGEVADFHFENFQTPIGPMLLMGCKPQDVAFVYAKTNTGLFSNAHTSVEKNWKKVNPNLPFEYYYQDSVFDFYFRIFSQVSKVMTAASVIMIVISITGIFGLALLILGRKMKEISVRKVLGAGIGNIIFIINKEFLFAVGFAILFGFPISWYLTGNLFHQISVESHVSVTPLIVSFIGLLLMIVVSVSWHIFKAHTANPTKYLKDE